MGLIVNIYRDDYDCALNVFHGKKSVTVVNIEGPFLPTDDSPAAELGKSAYGNPIILPLGKTRFETMFGGTYGATCDSRFSEAIGGMYGAIPIHDRKEW